MNVKKSLYGFLLITSLAFANDSELSKEFAYQNGVDDSKIVMKNYFKNTNQILNSEKYYTLDGFATMIDVTSFAEQKIIKASALGIKLGLDIKFISYNNIEYIVYAVNEREADAISLKQKLDSFGLNSIITPLNDKYIAIDLVATDLIATWKASLNKINQLKDRRIEQLEKALEKKAIVPTNNINTNKAPQKNIVIDLSSLQVINRVVTDRYLKANNLKIGKNVEPLNHTAQKEVTHEKVAEQIKTVTNNIKKDNGKPLPKINTFSELYSYLTEHGGITKDGILLLNGQTFKKGDKLIEWVISDINYSLGIVVMNNNYNVKVNK